MIDRILIPTIAKGPCSLNAMMAASLYTPCRRAKLDVMISADRNGCGFCRLRSRHRGGPHLRGEAGPCRGMQLQRKALSLSCALQRPMTMEIRPGLPKTRRTEIHCARTVPPKLIRCRLSFLCSMPIQQPGIHYYSKPALLPNSAVPFHPRSLFYHPRHLRHGPSRLPNVVALCGTCDSST